jgi:hypothetical protein
MTDLIGQYCPFGSIGDRLWVRETWCPLDADHWHEPDRPKDTLLIWGTPKRNGVGYAADCTSEESERCRKELGYKWRPSIHMPRWASRITLEITGVRVERLQDISEEDAKAEGVESLLVKVFGWNAPGGSYGEFPNEQPHRKAVFEMLWESIYGRGSWESNPYVWVVEFCRMQQKKVEDQK